MSWWSFWSSGSDSPKDDPLKKLDPSLKDFLAKEAQQHDAANAKQAAARPAAPIVPKQPIETPSHEEDENKVPPQSLYQDGRYAHLWKTYKPLSQIVAETKTDQEKVNDLFTEFKHRRAAVNRAALENCAIESEELDKCYRSGSWSDLMVGCKRQNRAVDKCFKTQTAFLKALGYLTMAGSTPEQDEIVQMRADSMYQELLRQEAAIDAARAAGQPAPKFEPVIKGAGHWKPGDVEPRIEDYFEPEYITQTMRDEFALRMKNTEEALRKLEAEGFSAEVKAGHSLMQQLGDLRGKQDAAREEREAQGQATFSDRVHEALSWKSK